MKKYLLLLLAVTAFLPAVWAHIGINEAESLKCICPNVAQQPIVLEVYGDAEPFTFQWEGPDGYTSTEESPADITQPGTYSVTVTNAYGCETVLSREVEACEPLEINGIENAIRHPSGCGVADGRLRFLNNPVTGGLEPYTFTLFDEAGNELPRGNGGGYAVWSELPGGDYVIYVQDALGCAIDESFTLMPMDGSPMLAGEVFPECQGQRNGFLSVLAYSSAPDATYHYQWNTGQTMTVEEGETVDLQSISAGTYCVTVTLQNATTTSGCDEVEACYTVPEVVATSPLSLELVEIDAYICPDVPYSGSIRVRAAGGVPWSGSHASTPYYQFMWSTGSNNAAISNRPTGTYCVTVTDYCGESVSECYTINAYPAVQFTGAVTRRSCVFNGADLSNGRIEIYPQSGTPPFSYAWVRNGGGVTSNIPVASSQHLNNVRAGNYFVIITDSNGCRQRLDFSMAQGVVSCGPDPFDCRYEDCYCDALQIQDNRFIGTYFDNPRTSTCSIEERCILNNQIWNTFTGYRVACCFFAQVNHPTDILIANCTVEYCYFPDFDVSVIASSSDFRDFVVAIDVGVDDICQIQIYNNCVSPYEPIYNEQFPCDVSERFDEINCGAIGLSAGNVYTGDIGMSPPFYCNGQGGGGGNFAPLEMDKSKREKLFEKIELKEIDKLFVSPDSILQEMRLLAVNKALSVYPNPASDKFTVVFSSHDVGLASLIVTDAFGRQIATYGYQVTNGLNYWAVDAKGYSSGTYFLTLKLPSGETSNISVVIE